MSYHIAFRAHPAERGRSRLPSNAGCCCCCCCLHSAGALLGAALGARVASRMIPIVSHAPAKGGDPVGAVIPRLDAVSLFWRLSFLAVLVYSSWMELAPLAKHGVGHYGQSLYSALTVPFFQVFQMVFACTVMALPVVLLAGAVLAGLTVALARYPHRLLGIRQLVTITLYMAGGTIAGFLAMWFISIVMR